MKRCNTTHTNQTAPATPRDPVTDLRVIDVGGARATYKIQNKGSVLSAYRKSITHNQTPEAHQQEQNRCRKTLAKAPHPNTSKGQLLDPRI